MDARMGMIMICVGWTVVNDTIFGDHTLIQGGDMAWWRSRDHWQMGFVLPEIITKKQIKTSLAHAGLNSDHVKI